MGGSQSLWALTGNVDGEGTSASKAAETSVGIDDLVKLESFKIDGRQVLESSFKVHDAEGKTIFQALPLTSSRFSSHVYKEIFRVSDSCNVDVIRVFECSSTNLEDGDISSLPGPFMGYVKIVKETLSKPEFHILNEKGETRLVVRPDALRITSNDYQVYSDDETCKIGKFGPRISAGIKGKMPRDLEAGLKAGVLLSAVVVCGKSEKERKRTVILVASK